MNTADLIVDLQKRGAVLNVDGERLRVEAPNGVLSPELKQLLRTHKAEIVSLIHSRQTSGHSDELSKLIAQHDTVSETWNKTFDELETMKQDSPEFERLFGEWQKADEEYKRLCDRIDCVEITDEIRQGTKHGTAVPKQIVQGANQG